MMACYYHRWRVQRVLDDGVRVLPPRTARHVAACPACAAAWEGLRQVDARLRVASTADISAAPMLVAAVQRRLADGPRRAAPVDFGRGRMVGALAAAAIVLAVAGVWFDRQPLADRAVRVPGAGSGPAEQVLALAPQWLTDALGGDGLAREGRLLAQDIQAVVEVFSDSLPAVPSPGT